MTSVPRCPLSAGDAAVPPCLDRRAFLANSGLLAVAAALASACGDGQIGNMPTAPVTTGGKVLTVRTADLAELGAVGGIAVLTDTSPPLAIVRSAAASYRAFSRVCPHQGTFVTVLNGSSFRCPNHGATFTSGGQWTGGERTGNLTEFAVTADAAAGTLTIRY